MAVPAMEGRVNGIEEDAKWLAMSDARKQLIEEHFASRLRLAGYIVVPPTARKVYHVGPLVITSDPIGFTIGLRRRR